MFLPKGNFVCKTKINKPQNFPKCHFGDLIQLVYAIIVLDFIVISLYFYTYVIYHLFFIFFVYVYGSERVKKVRK